MIAAVCLLVGGLAFVAYQWSSGTFSGPSYRERLSERYVLTIRIENRSDSSYDRLRVTFHDSPTLAAYVVDRLDLRPPDDGWSFTSVYDADSGTRCVYDDAGAGFLLLFHESDDDLWVTGRRFGWQGTQLPPWQERLDRLRQQFPGIPYESLPQYDAPEQFSPERGV